jgi:lysyl-tRNA synthetase class 2
LADLAICLLGVSQVDAVSYRDAFCAALDLDPLEASTSELAEAARQVSGTSGPSEADRDTWLNVLWALRVQPGLGAEAPVLVGEYPASQAALATISQNDPRVANRFELFYRGIELANGYHELLDPHELRRRFQVANQHRREAGKYTLPETNRLLTALQSGLPPCVGVALGFDRLVMLACGLSQISQTIAFPIGRA